MKNILIPTLLLINLPSLAYASVDFTQTVSGNAMLLLFLTSVVAVVAAFIGKIIWSKMEKKLEEQTKKAENKEEEVYRSELKLKEQEITQLKVRVDRIELEQNSCQRNLPMAYVTRPEYDKFVLQHREEFTNLMNRMEGMIKEVRVEIKTDMQVAIDRIVELVGTLMDKK